jgi:hypothetical protein
MSTLHASWAKWHVSNSSISNLRAVGGATGPVGAFWQPFAMPSWEFAVGDSVELARGCSVDNGCLAAGAVGSVVTVADE